MTLQSILDGIMPNLVPLAGTFLVYYLIKKGQSTTRILLGILVLGILGAAIGFF